MFRNVVFCLLALTAITACDRDKPRRTAAAAPIPAATPPIATTAPAPIPSVPADIAKATPPKKPPRKPVESAQPEPNESGANENEAGQDDGDQDYDEDGSSENQDFDDDGGQLADQGEPASVAVHWGGLGDFAFGTDADELRENWPGELEDHDAEASEACFYLSETRGRPSDAPALMFEDGRFVRFDVDTPRFAAPGGGRVGMDTLEIMERYGEDAVERLPHKYSDGEYLRVESPEGGTVLLFETGEEGVVTEWRIGVEPQIDYVEGCA